MAQRFLSPPAGGSTHTLSLPGGLHEVWHDSDVDGVIDVPHDMGTADWDIYSGVGTGGWVPASTNGAGPSSARPAGVTVGATFIDLTLQLSILFDGIAWRDPVTGKFV